MTTLKVITFTFIFIILEMKQYNLQSQKLEKKIFVILWNCWYYDNLSVIDELWEINYVIKMQKNNIIINFSLIF